MLKEVLRKVFKEYIDVFEFEYFQNFDNAVIDYKRIDFSKFIEFLVEIDNKKVIEGVSKGIEVINLDINTGLKRFNDNQFDVVILSQTLQSIKNVDETIEEILRIS